MSPRSPLVGGHAATLRPDEFCARRSSGAVQASIDECNQGNNNGDWTLSTTSDEGEADVDVPSVDRGGRVGLRLVRLGTRRSWWWEDLQPP